MDGHNRRRGSLGTIYISEQPTTTESSLKRSVYEWRPGSRIAEMLPDSFGIRIDCYTDCLGRRRFVPTAGAKTFLLPAALAGEALLARRQSRTQPTRNEKRALRLFVQLAPNLREHLERNFKREGDFYVPKRTRYGDDHVLPEHLGLDGSGRGQAWKPSDLIREGMAAATSEAFDIQMPETYVRRGLLEAARRYPINVRTLTKAAALAIVRIALFDLGLSAISTSQLKIVTERLMRTLGSHLGDDTASFTDSCAAKGIFAAQRASNDI